MKKILFLSLLIAFGCKQIETSDQTSTPTFGIVIHGGAGTILRANMTPEREAAYRELLAEAIQVGHTILKNGGSSQEAVEKTIILWKILHSLTQVKVLCSLRMKR
jgi:beta-aspartyl-peptidase (threonine type)